MSTSGVAATIALSIIAVTGICAASVARADDLATDSAARPVLLAAKLPEGLSEAEKQRFEEGMAKARERNKRAVEKIRRTATLVYAQDSEADDQVVAAFDDGSIIVLTDTQGEDSKILKVGPDRKATKLVDGGEELHKIEHTGEGGRLSAVDFDHSSQKLVYSVGVRNGSYVPKTFVYDLKIGEKKEVFEAKSGQKKVAYFGKASAISPGGKFVATSGVEKLGPKSLRFFIAILNVATGKIAEVDSPQEWGWSMGGMCWGAAAKHLYVGMLSQAEARIVRYSMDSGEFESVYLAATAPSVSADGEKLAFIQAEELYVLDFTAERGGSRRVASGTIKNIEWNPRGDKLYVTAVADEQGRNRVFRIDVLPPPDDDWDERAGRR